MLEIAAVPAFTDNYIWLVRDEASEETAVVDPGDAAPALAEAERRGWRITQVWNTHKHWDHTNGNLAVKGATGCSISGPGEAPNHDVSLAEGDRLRIGNHAGRVLEIPGHTLGHIAIVFEEDRVAFVGDTLFAMGCGRLF
jgi:hydroxyacylglutathione hydrolase